MNQAVLALLSISLLSAPGLTLEERANSVDKAANTPGPAPAVPGGAKEGLPSPSSPGCLSRVNDDVRGIPIDRGDQSRNVTGEMINVKDFGAKGDGVANDTEAINSALGAAAGKVLFFPPGTYLTSGNHGVGSNMVITGAGKGLTTIKFLRVGFGTKLFKNADPENGNTRITIRNCTMDGNRAANSVTRSLTAVHWTHVTHSSVEYTRITGFTQHGIDASVDNSDNLFFGNEIDDYGTGKIGFAIVVLGGSQRNRMIGNHIVSTRENVGLAVDDQSDVTPPVGVSCTGNIIANNVIWGTEKGIYIVGGQRNVVVGNTITLPTSYAIYVTASDSSEIDAVGNVIEGNTIEIAPASNVFGVLVYGTGTRIISNTVSGGHIGIYQKDMVNSVGEKFISSDNLISGNYVVSQSLHGVQVAGGVRTTIANNQIRSSGDTAILITTDGAQTDVEGLVIEGNTISSAQNYGILIASGEAVGIQHIMVRGNLIIDIGLAGNQTKSAVFVSKGAAPLDHLSIHGTRSVATTAIVPARLVEIGGSPTNVDTWDNRAWGWLPPEESDRDGGLAVLQHLSSTMPWDPSIVDGAVATTTLTVMGAAVGDAVAVGFSLAVPAGALLVGAVTEPNTVSVTLFNKTGAPLDLASGIIRAHVWKQ